jgi:hypothetical protein
MNIRKAIAALRASRKAARDIRNAKTLNEHLAAACRYAQANAAYAAAFRQLKPISHA